MNPIKHTIALALGACLALSATHAVAQSPAQQPERLHTWSVTINPQGQVSSWQLNAGQDDAYAGQLANMLRGWHFSAQDAVAGQSVQTFVRVVSRADAQGAPQVLDVSVGPTPNRLSAPVYPQASQRAGAEGVVVLRLQLDASGAVSQREVFDTQGVVDRRMAAAAMSAARDWQFTPEVVAGQAVAGEVLFPVCFYVSENRDQTCTWNGPQRAEHSGLAIVQLTPSVQLSTPIASAR